LSRLEVEGLITFLYYNSLEEAEDFYENVMGFEKTVDQGWAKIFRVRGAAHVGLVDGKRGYHRPSSTKPVMVTVVVSDVDAWYRYLNDKGVKILSEPKDNAEINIRAFLLEDPEGYVIEIQKFY
jgi:lactoylglutathione lyase